LLLRLNQRKEREVITMDSGMFTEPEALPNRFFAGEDPIEGLA